MAGSEASAAAPPRAPPVAGAGTAAALAALRGRPFVVFEAAAAPPQAPPARTAAPALRGLLKPVGDAALLGFFCLSWANLAANGAAVAARRACGEDSRAEAVAKRAAGAAIVAMGVLAPVAVPRLFWIIDRWPKAGNRHQVLGFAIPFMPFLPQLATPFPSLGFTIVRVLVLRHPVREWSRQEGQRAARPSCEQWRWGGARPCPNAGPASVTLALQVAYFCVFVMLLGMLIQDHAPAKDSYQGMFGSAISDMASLIAMLVLCFFLIPGMIIQLKRHGCDGLWPPAARRMNYPSSGE